MPLSRIITTCPDGDEKGVDRSYDSWRSTDLPWVKTQRKQPQNVIELQGFSEGSPRQSILFFPLFIFYITPSRTFFTELKLRAN